MLILPDYRGWLRRLVTDLDRVLMPLRCVFCGTRTPDRASCRACRDDLPWSESIRTQTPLPVTVAPLCYEFPVDAALKALKFRRRLYYAPAFGELLCDVMHHLPEPVDALLPVPLHWRRQAYRGFNQATEIGKVVGRRFDLPVLGGVVRHRATRSQSGLEGAERSSNLRNAFTVRKPVTARHVLIIDDVITTGATTAHLARALLANGVESVSAMAVARSVRQAG